MALFKAAAALFRKTNFPLRSSFTCISTSKKSKDTLVFPSDIFPRTPPPPPTTVEDFAETKNVKNWVSYGYDEESYETDRHHQKVTCFCVFTAIMCGCTFIFAYLPDFHEKDWTLREAYLELHRRETLGLPLIDKNFIDPATIELPSDEELGDTEIII